MLKHSLYFRHPCANKRIHLPNLPEFVLGPKLPGAADSSNGSPIHNINWPSSITKINHTALDISAWYLLLERCYCVLLHHLWVLLLLVLLVLVRVVVPVLLGVPGYVGCGEAVPARG